MPTYVYEVLQADGSPGPRFERIEPISDPPLTRDPLSGLPVRRVFSPPHIACRHTPGKSKALLDNQRLEKAGFTKYEKDRLTGEYHRVAGSNGPASFRKPEP